MKRHCEKKLYYDIEELYEEICRKSFHIEPFKAKVRFKKLKELLGAADYWVDPENPVARLKIKILKKLRFSNAIVGVILHHEIAHVVSKQKKHNDKFYKVFFKAAQTKFGRKFF